MNLQEIISDEEIARVHGHANFGSLTPREVVSEGVLKYAFGYHSGHTQLCILVEHGLTTKPRPGSYDASLTKKGKRYARATGAYHALTRAAPAADANRMQIIEADAEWLFRWLSQHKEGGHCGEGNVERRERGIWNDRIERILAALKSTAAGQAEP